MQQMQQLMSDPQALQAVIQMQQSMQTLSQRGFGPGGLGLGGMGGMGGLGLGGLGGLNGMGAAPGTNAGPGGLDFSSLFGGNAGMPTSSTPQQPQTQVTQEDPSVTYASQLQQLQDMGFSDATRNIAALRATSGNVNAAVERLLSGL